MPLWHIAGTEDISILQDKKKKTSAFHNLEKNTNITEDYFTKIQTVWYRKIKLKSSMG